MTKNSKRLNYFMKPIRRPTKSKSGFMRKTIKGKPAVNKTDLLLLFFFF